MIDYTVTFYTCPSCGSDEVGMTIIDGEFVCRKCLTRFKRPTSSGETIDCASMSHSAPDPVNHPPHYTRGGYECAEVAIALGLSYCLGNVLKYVWRCGHKSDALEDLRKARWYLDREIRRVEGGGDAT